MTQFTKIYDLDKRTLEFSRQIIMFVKGSPKDMITKPLLEQLIRSATSIGANYSEANNASSKKDFRNKIMLCKKEAQETRYWLLLLDTYYKGEDLKALTQESYELVLIFQKICNSL